jgi:hypothetical protein
MSAFRVGKANSGVPMKMSFGSAGIPFCRKDPISSS